MLSTGLMMETLFIKPDFHATQDLGRKSGCARFDAE
ncbi:hypothetical protein X772_00100 [Mesorhizobium sp. LSJC280B00]|nr:hypothetical protein X772_00100 [Mesorhizobium sp. LSJC280B00]